MTARKCTRSTLSRTGKYRVRRMHAWQVLALVQVQVQVPVLALVPVWVRVLVLVLVQRLDQMAQVHIDTASPYHVEARVVCSHS